MGYTQHWFRPETISRDVFCSIKSDFQKLILPMADMGVLLAGPFGEDEPEIDDEQIRFNGVHQCGHPENKEICVPYPADDARGLGSSASAVREDLHALVVKLRHRCCGGHCAHESFCFPRVVLDDQRRIIDEPDLRDLCFFWTKTAFKAYDIAVTAALLIAKRYLADQLVVHSDGRDAQWDEAKGICQRHLGYGDWFGIVEDPQVEWWPGPNGTQKERWFGCGFWWR